MTGKLCILCCQNFRPEVEAAVDAEAWSDVEVVSYPSRCGQPPVHWDELRALVRGEFAQVLLLGRACIQELGDPPEGWPPVRLMFLEECFHLVAGTTLVSEAIARGAYLVTPGWLEDWRGNLQRLGFDEANAAEFFQDFARELVLLDTGVTPDVSLKFSELAQAVELPATREAVGIDYTRLLLARQVAEWRLDEERHLARKNERDHSRERADQLAAMDFLGHLAQLKDERQTIATIIEMFHMLFSPEKLYYLRVEGGRAQRDATLPPELLRQCLALGHDWAWTESGSGFLLRITRADELLGVIVADGFAFAEYRDHYLDLALSVAGVLGLAIENARTYERIKDAEAALSKSAYSLKMAQAIAHIGHWEWSEPQGDMRWSDETYRILGYEPNSVTPSPDNFFQVMHPDDRAKVANYISQAHEEGHFDIEYRIVLPDGRVRVVHGVGEVVLLGADSPPELIGVVHDVTECRPTEVIGVIQDITDRKELESKLAQEARTDPLTGCANRRQFQELARQELARVRRYGGELSALMLDLDYFKSINDRYGHPSGDLTLQTLVRVCRTTLREEDIIGRLGGEEFALLLLHTGRAKALEVAERLRQAVAAAEVPLEHQAPLRFTTSIGVATVTPDDFSMDRVLARADRALYQAKASGRNKVVAEGH